MSAPLNLPSRSDTGRYLAIVSNTPWEIAIAAPIASLVLGQWLANRSAQKQGERDAVQRREEREHQLELARIERDRAVSAEQVQQEAAATRERTERWERTHVRALDAIAGLRAQLSLSSLDSNGMTYPEPVDVSAFKEFISAMSAVSLLHPHVTTAASAVITDVEAYIRNWAVSPAAARGPEAIRLNNWLGTLGTNIATSHRGKVVDAVEGQEADSPASGPTT